MKKHLLYALFKNLYDHPKHRRKLKIFAAAGLVGVVALTGLTIWAGLAAVNFAGQMASHVVIPQEVLAVRDSLTNRNPETAADCWNKAKTMMTVDTWIKTPLQENFRQLKKACSNQTDQQKRSET